MVASQQTHTTNVRLVTEEDAGKGVVRGRDYTDVDGLITNVAGLTLATFYADCVPLYIFWIPKHKAIGLSHSGWRGTVNRMGQCTINAMKKAFGTDPKDRSPVLAQVSVRIVLKWEKKWQRRLWKASNQVAYSVLWENVRTSTS